MHIIHSKPSILLGSRLSLSYVVVVSSVPSYNRCALIVLLYHQFWSSTLHGTGSVPSHIIMISYATSCTALFNLSKRRSPPIALTPMEGVSLSIGTWDNSSPPRVPDEVVRLKGLSDECNMTRLYNVLCHPRRKEKLHGRLWRSSSWLFWHPLI
jgi:hypothetical protein